MLDTSVKFFRSTDPGAPSYNNAAASIPDLLHACLVTGFGSSTLSTLVVASGVATATVSTGHGFSNFGSTGVGPVVLVAGATPSGLNGEKRIVVTGATTFTFDATGVADGTATGTITAKMAPAGWERVFSGTSKAVFRSQAVDSERLYCRVDGSVTANYARLVGYESMTDVDTGTNPFPTAAQVAGGLYMQQPVISTLRPWFLVASDRDWFLIGDQANTSTWYLESGWWEPLRKKAGDVYATSLCAVVAAVATSAFLYQWVSATAKYTARGINGAAGAINSQITGPHRAVTYSVHPENPSVPANDGQFRVYAPELWDSLTTSFRGLIPGLLATNLAAAADPQYLLVTDGPMGGHAIAWARGAGAGANGIAFDITGPWR